MANSSIPFHEIYERVKSRVKYACITWHVLRDTFQKSVYNIHCQTDDDQIKNWECTLNTTKSDVLQDVFSFHNTLCYVSVDGSVVSVVNVWIHVFVGYVKIQPNMYLQQIKLAYYGISNNP